jgi:hypothetical protein
LFVQSVTTKVRRRVPTRYRPRSRMGSREVEDFHRLKRGGSVIDLHDDGVGTESGMAWRSESERYWKQDVSNGINESAGARIGVRLTSMRYMFSAPMSLC